jgi:non-specific protein-tyrosine kinase
VELDDALQEWDPDGVTVLPSGPVPPNPAELLGSGEMSQLVRTLESRFDLVLLDTPPVLPVTDSAVLSTVVDGALLVVRSTSTTREQARRALRSLSAVGGRVYGVVLVGAELDPRDGYGYGYAPRPTPNVLAGKRG